MLARTVDHLPVGEQLVYEPKWDGFRAIADHGDGRVTLTSRSGKRLDLRFPEVADAVREQIPPQTVLDGELVRWSGDRLDFEALQRRNRASTRTARALARREPCHYIVFDLLRLEGADLARRSLERRREALERLFDGVEQPSPLTLGWQTADPETARDWYDTLPEVGVEGLVVKDARRSYRPGRRDWEKYKHHLTTEAIVAGTIGPPDQPRELLLGRYDSRTGDLRVAGHTTELAPEQRDALGELLRRAEGDHPWPRRLAPRWGGKDPIVYVQVEPEVVVEVRVDPASTAERWRHVVRYLRPRTELRAQDVPRDLDIET
ncbi:ATP-dependent DNA ligase [Marinitenerispora sediminis]|uniref:ATP-dependent DNA ligase n=2 Tax=Marinitenerispora sediminis TaxID=1931232 RepID=A0A368T1X1_9ACTN|nr:ATP-dependent DNA ligase [Marinitenerispora sediminis]RCV49231.1 ATP-dependent DNA ligase [Marinitenerispora sediminis]RCV49653.1 ATP-dependent DNA ligase [Marinitenerispora sediminis]RCV54346.1 ATP-dependent DNA ligase [Marinitenerispora sediminis]